MSCIGLEYPVIFDVAFEDAAGNISSCLVEQVNWRNAFELSKPEETTILTTFCDDVVKSERTLMVFLREVSYEGEIGLKISVLVPFSLVLFFQKKKKKKK